MLDSTWKQRVNVLNDAGYARYQERTATMLEDTVRLLADRRKGDLRTLRDEADRDPAAERELLKEFKGVGDVGVDIFFREAQAAWDELYPFADRRALAGAEKLGLGESARDLTRHVSKKDFVPLLAALVRVELAGEHDLIREAAR